MVNLQVLSVTVLFIDLELSDVGKESAINTSTGIVFVQFLCIIFFHLYKLVYSKVNRKCSCAKQRNIVLEDEAPYYNLASMDGGGENEGSERVFEAGYLEDYAVNVDIQNE